MEAKETTEGEAIGESGEESGVPAVEYLPTPIKDVTETLVDGMRELSVTAANNDEGTDSVTYQVVGDFTTYTTEALSNLGTLVNGAYETVAELAGEVTDAE